MKKLVTIALLALCVLLLLTACGDGETTPCKHEFGEWETFTETSCVADGTKTRTCALCSHTEAKKETSSGHKYGEWTLYGNITDGGYCENNVFCATCETCNEVSFKREESSDHKFAIVTVEPTCTAVGYDERTCSVCGKVERVNEKSILPHEFANEYSSDGLFHWLACTGCDEIKDKAEHTAGNDGACSTCNTQILPTEGIVYNLSSDGTYAEVIGYSGSATQILIASEYNGVPVTGICNEAFKNTSITSVIIPDSVISIGSYAFFYCFSLSSVTIGNGVTSIGDYAFENCLALQSVTVKGCLKSIGIMYSIVCTLT